MNQYLQMASAFSLVCVGIWFFGDTIIFGQEQQTLAVKNYVANKVIRVGPEGECGVNVPLETWEEMNRMQVYKWVVACEDSLKGE